MSCDNVDQIASGRCDLSVCEWNSKDSMTAAAAHKIKKPLISSRRKGGTGHTKASRRRVPSDHCPCSHNRSLQTDGSQRVVDESRTSRKGGPCLRPTNRVTAPERSGKRCHSIPTPDCTQNFSSVIVLGKVEEFVPWSNQTPWTKTSVMKNAPTQTRAPCWPSDRRPELRANTKWNGGVTQGDERKPGPEAMEREKSER